MLKGMEYGEAKVLGEALRADRASVFKVRQAPAEKPCLSAFFTTCPVLRRRSSMPRAC